MCYFLFFHFSERRHVEMTTLQWNWSPKVIWRWHISSLKPFDQFSETLRLLFHTAWLTTHDILCILGEPEIWHQHPVLEDRWSPDGDQSGEACSAEKCSNRRSEATSLSSLCSTLILSVHLIMYLSSFFILFRSLPSTRSRLHVRVFPL